MAGNTVRPVSVDMEDWVAALPRLRLAEAALLSLINTALSRERLDCRIEALCHVEKRDRNWEVAKFTMGHRTGFSMQERLEERLQERLQELAVLIVRASDGMDVAWPSIARH